MHVQGQQIHDIAERAHAAGKSSCWAARRHPPRPKCTPTSTISTRRDGRCNRSADRLPDESVARPPAQIRFETKERLPLQDFPIPAYDLIPLKNYLMLTLQFSSGAPICASSATFPISTAASRGSRPPRRSPPSSMPCASRRASAGGVFRRRQFRRQSQSR
jgi:hypothetical protein